MAFLKLSVLFFTLLFLSCHNYDHSSRVEYFQYQGYSDTIVSLLYGQVFEQKSATEKNLIPLPGVQVSVVEDTVKSVTDKLGQFIIPLYEGTYTLLITKKGYQPLTISNYFSHSDRVSTTKIILVNGTKRNEYRIPDKK